MNFFASTQDAIHQHDEFLLLRHLFAAVNICVFFYTCCDVSVW